MDRYDEAIAHFTRFYGTAFELVVQLLSLRPQKEHGSLFAFCGPKPHDSHYGSLTQIRHNPKTYQAATPELTAAIHADERLPECVENITREHLPLFAEWQRKIDELYPNRWEGTK